MFSSMWIIFKLFFLTNQFILEMCPIAPTVKASIKELAAQGKFLFPQTTLAQDLKLHKFFKLSKAETLQHFQQTEGPPTYT